MSPFAPPMNQAISGAVAQATQDAVAIAIRPASGRGLVLWSAHPRTRPVAVVKAYQIATQSHETAEARAAAQRRIIQ